MRYTQIFLGLRHIPILGWLTTKLMALFGPDIPLEVQIGHALRLAHRGQGVVVAPRTRIGDRVTIFHQVTIGAAEVTQAQSVSSFGGVVIDDDAILCAGCKVLAGKDPLTVGAGTIVGANAVLLKSTGEFEIWAGMPARRIGLREHRGVSAGL